MLRPWRIETGRGGSYVGDGDLVGVGMRFKKLVVVGVRGVRSESGVG